MGIISDRADRFANRLRPPGPPPDNRSTAEKMAEFSQKYDVATMLKTTRSKVKEMRNA